MLNEAVVTKRGPRNHAAWTEDRIEAAVDRLVSLYSGETLVQDLRPQTLRNEGGDLQNLYWVAFRRNNRSPWAEARFPNGFKSLVDEVNGRLLKNGKPVINSKVEVARYHRLPQAARDVIAGLQAMVERREITREKALATLKEKHKIELSDAKIRYYFPEMGPHSAEESQPDRLKERKRKLARRIDDIKADWGIDLSLRVCVKGLVFESFVGAYLAHTFDRMKVKPQVALPVKYTDRENREHALVFLDYLVEEEGQSQIYEVKYRNSYDNIITSILAQLYAQEHQTGRRQKVQVIYRHPCPHMRFALERKIPISPEAEAFGLTDGDFAERLLNEVVDYVSIEELFAQDPDALPFALFLRELDRGLEQAGSSVMRNWIQCLDRIAGQDEQIPERLEKLSEWLKRGEAVPPSEMRRFFGARTFSSQGEGQSLRRRIAIIVKDIRGRQDKLLLEIYNRHFGAELKSISEKMVRALEELPEPVFSDLALKCLAEKEERTHAALIARKHARAERREEKEVIGAFESIEKRARDAFERELTKAKLAHLDRFRTFDLNTVRFAEMTVPEKDRLTLPQLHRVLQQEGGFTGSPDKLRQTQAGLVAQEGRVQSSLFNSAKRWNGIIIGESLAHALRMGQTADPSLEIGRVMIEIRSTREWLRSESEAARSSELGQALLKTAERIDSRCSSLSARERRDILSRRVGLDFPGATLFLGLYEAFLKDLEAAVHFSPSALTDIGGVAGFFLHAQNLDEMKVVLRRGSSEIFSNVIGCARYTLANEGQLLGVDPFADSRRYLQATMELVESLRLLNGTDRAPDCSKFVPIYFKTLNAVFGSSVPQSTWSEIRSDMDNGLQMGRGKAMESALGVLAGIVHRRGPELKLARKLRDRPEWQGVTLKGAWQRLLEDFPDETLRELEAQGILIVNLISDFFKRKWDQAQMMAYFDESLARLFLMQDNPDANLDLSNFEAARTTLRELSRQNDELFISLMA